MDESEGYIFGLQIRDDWHLIGNVYIFMDSLADLLPTEKDTAPIIDTKAVVQGRMQYSLSVSAKDKEGKKVELMLIDSIAELLEHELTVNLTIHEG